MVNPTRPAIKKLTNDELSGILKDWRTSYDYEIDGISGATLTSNGVTNMIRYWLGENGYGPVLQQLREGIVSA